MATRQGEVARVPAIVTAGGGIGAVSQQDTDDASVAMLGGALQRGPSTVLGGVRVGAVAEKKFNQREVAAGHRRVQRLVGHRVARDDIHTRAVGHEELRHLHAAIERREVKRRPAVLARQVDRRRIPMQELVHERSIARFGGIRELEGAHDPVPSRRATAATNRSTSSGVVSKDAISLTSFRGSSHI